MIAVIFEVRPAPGNKQEYLDIAASLRRELDHADGFISIERFESLTNEGKILSLSFWRDDKAVENWRRVQGHRLAQSRGRGGVFSEYRLRVAEVIRDYGIVDRDEAPSDSRDFHERQT
jgi:heme-degrading monooxygenase HmoA